MDTETVSGRIKASVVVLEFVSQCVPLYRTDNHSTVEVVSDGARL